MDNTLLELERQFNANPTLETAEKLVRAKQRSESLSSLYEVPTEEFASTENWILLNEFKSSYLYGFQLPHGVMVVLDGYETNSAAFIPGIKLV